MIAVLSAAAVVALVLYTPTSSEPTQDCLKRVKIVSSERDAGRKRLVTGPLPTCQTIASASDSTNDPIVEPLVSQIGNVGVQCLPIHDAHMGRTFFTDLVARHDVLALAQQAAQYFRLDVGDLNGPPLDQCDQLAVKWK